MDENAKGTLVSRRDALRVGAGAAVGAAVGAAGAAGQAAAQTPPAVTNQPNISLAAAIQMLTAAEAKAREINVPMTLVVVDASGALKAAARMDGNAFGSIEIVMRKAITAAGFRTATHVLGERTFAADAARAASFANLPNIWLGGGGLPIMRDGAVIGAIGAGGGTPQQDIDVAQAGLDALA